jgi:hypothetical protein
MECVLSTLGCLGGCRYLVTFNGPETMASAAVHVVYITTSFNHDLFDVVNLDYVLTAQANLVASICASTSNSTFE